LRAVQLRLGHTKLKSTARYLGIEVDDALEMSEQTGNLKLKRSVNYSIRDRLLIAVAISGSVDASLKMAIHKLNSNKLANDIN
jgi:hypothetical protein